MWESLPQKTQPERHFPSNRKPRKSIKLLLKAQKAFTDTHEYFSRHFSRGHMFWSMLTFQFYLLTLSCLHCCPSLNGLPSLQWRWVSHLDNNQVLIPGARPTSQRVLWPGYTWGPLERWVPEMCRSEYVTAVSIPPSADYLVFHVGLFLGR